LSTIDGFRSVRPKLGEGDNRMRRVLVAVLTAGILTWGAGAALADGVNEPDGNNNNVGINQVGQFVCDGVDAQQVCP
jgi:hypothetical protein